jgi:asparaginyl-tRNA synthetase
VDDAAYFSLRNRRTEEIQRLRSEALCHTISFFNQHGFMLVDPPILHEHIQKRKKSLTLSAGVKCYDLNASNALYMSAYAAVFGNVYAISPAFRNEAKSPHHLIEFRMVECEALGCDFEGCVDLVQNYISFILETVQEKNMNRMFGERINFLRRALAFDRISYKDIISKLKSAGMGIAYGDDLSICDREASKVLGNTSCVFVSDYPCPPATWTALPKAGGTTYTFNLLLPEGWGELAEGGQRNNDYRLFQEKFRGAGISSLSWYCDAVKASPPVRSGFGLGLERLVRWLAGITEIREAALFPREGN